jgi:hypothetical protein
MKYKLKAYYIENEKEQVFWCKDTKMRNITNEMGASLPMSNGERLLETDSPLDFKMNKKVKIGNEILLIQNEPNSIVDDNDLNVMRGNPDYIKMLLVR